jgi:hypothetical protein
MFWNWQDHAAAIALGTEASYNYSSYPARTTLKIFDAGHQITVDYTDHRQKPTQVFTPIQPSASEAPS